MIRLLGVGNSLITGLQGAGKSHFVMSQIKQILDEQPELHIFLVNVDGVKLQSPNLHIVDASFSWVNDAPNNSVIIYDEAGIIDRFNNSNSRINSSEDVQRLTMARHQGKTIVFVAQDSSIVHPAVRKLLTRHFHFSNPYNDRNKTHCFIFPQVQDRLDGQNKYWQQNAVEEFKHELDPEIFPLYKSVDDGAAHNKTKQVNAKAQRAMRVAITAAILIIPAIVIAIYFGFSYYNDVWGNKSAATHHKDIKQDTKQAQSAAQQQNTAASVTSAEQSATTQTYIQDQNDQYARTKRIYVKRLPEDYEIITQNPDIRPAGAIKIGNECRVYNAHGDLMHYEKSECEYLLAEVGRMPKSRSAHTFVSSHTQTEQTIEPIDVATQQKAQLAEQ